LEDGKTEKEILDELNKMCNYQEMHMKLNDINTNLNSYFNMMKELKTFNEGFENAL